MKTIVKNTIKSFVSADNKAGKERGKVIELLTAEGYKYTDFISPNTKGDEKSTSTPEEYAELKGAVVAGFTTTEQKLMAQDAKSVAEGKKEQRRYLLQQVGSKMKDLKNALKKRAEAEEAKSNPKPPVAPETKIAELINEAIKKVQAYEGNGLKDIPEMVAHLQAARNNIKG